MYNQNRLAMFFLVTILTVFIGIIGIQSTIVITYMYGGLFVIFAVVIIICDLLKHRLLVEGMPYYLLCSVKILKKKIIYSYVFISIVLVCLAYKCMIEHDLYYGKTWGHLIVLFLWILVFRLIINMGISVSMRNLLKNGHTFVVLDLIRTIFYYFPRYVRNRIEIEGFWPKFGSQYRFGVIYYIFENKCYEESMKGGTVLSERLNQDRLDKLMDIGLEGTVNGLVVSFFLLTSIWTEQNIWEYAVKCLAILVTGLPMVFDMLVTTYFCQLYRWNREWEEYYRGILEQGMAAPNIMTIEFPEIK